MVRIRSPNLEERFKLLLPMHTLVAGVSFEQLQLERQLFGLSLLIDGKVYHSDVGKRKRGREKH